MSDQPYIVHYRQTNDIWVYVDAETREAAEQAAAVKGRTLKTTTVFETIGSGAFDLEWAISHAPDEDSAS